MDQAWTAPLGYRPTDHLGPAVEVEVTPDAVYLRNPRPLVNVRRNLIATLNAAVQSFGDRPFLHERPTPDADWRSVTFAAFAAQVSDTAGRLKDRGVGPGDRVVILARNSIAHLTATFAVMAVGGVAVPMTPLYLMHPQGSALLGGLARSVGSRLALIDDDLLAGPAAGLDLAPETTGLAALSSRAGEPVDLARAEADIASESVAKIHFTSGSTGTPKPVLNTHGMLTAAIAMVDQTVAKTPDGEPEVAVDWLPWHHTYGGNVNIHACLEGGARFYIDTGMPTPAGLPVTIRNLAEIGPTTLATVPAAFAPMLAAFEVDPELGRAVLRNVRKLSFGGASLAASVVEGYGALSNQLFGETIQFGSGYGMTETAGIIALVHWPTIRGDLLGLPVPGVEMKLVEQEDGRYDCRVRGPNVFAGYPGHDSQPFDDEGFFVTGDAVRAADPTDWREGLTYAGRIAEDFKLANGVWVRAGALRARALERLGALAVDAVVVGAGRDAVGLLVLTSAGVSHDQIRERLTGRFEAARGASSRIDRVALLAFAPDPSAGEVTAKGSLNVARVSANRAAEIDAMFADERCRLDR